MVLVLVLWALINIVLLYLLVNLMTKKGRAEPVSHTDRLTQNEQYTQKLEHCASRLAEITEELNVCLRMYEAESDGVLKAELEEKINSLKKQQELAQSKCGNLLNKLD